MELAISLYTISDDKLREELLTSELEESGWESHPDQSTYVYPMDKEGQYFLINKFDKWLTDWGKNKKKWSSHDFIVIHYLSPIDKEQKLYAIKDQTYRLP